MKRKQEYTGRCCISLFVTKVQWTRLYVNTVKQEAMIDRMNNEYWSKNKYYNVVMPKWLLWIGI